MNIAEKTGVALQLSWRVEHPIIQSTEATHNALPEWMRQLWSLRGQVYYADARRPQFRVGEQEFCDADQVDLRAYHVLACSGDRIVGCVRLVPLTTGIATATERIVGTKRFRQFFEDVQLNPSMGMEGGRLAVACEHRNSYLGMHLIAGAIALSAHFGFRTIVLTCGTRDRQNVMFSRFGGKPLNDGGPITSSEWADDLLPMYIPMAKVPGRYGELVQRMRVVLGLSKECPS